MPLVPESNGFRLVRFVDDTLSRETVAPLAAIGITAFTTTRHAGSFALNSNDPSQQVWSRWLALSDLLAGETSRLAFANQVHGADVVEHSEEWTGILRVPAADGHISFRAATAMAVTLADCVPVFIGHPSGAAALVHSGWKGTAAGITVAAIRYFRDQGLPPEDLVVHTGPAICGKCYEVGAEVIRALTGAAARSPARVDLRSLILDQAGTLGVRQLSTSTSCTRCNNDDFFSHRAGDSGRQLGVIVSRSGASHRAGNETRK